MYKKRINKAIESGIDFLIENQLNSGEFPTTAASTHQMKGGYLYNSPFVTSFVLYSIKGLRHLKHEEITKKALYFLLSEQEKGGIWRNHTKKNPYHQRVKLPPDLDDISAISYILKIYGISFDDNNDLIRNSLNENNQYLTWIEPPFENEVDCVVNTNVLLYLGENDPHICFHINEVIREDLTFSRWYPDKLSFYYIVSRAFENGITNLGNSKDKIIGEILNRQNVNGSFGNDLENAFALNVLHNFYFAGKAIETGTKYLVDSQSSDGSWNLCMFFSGFNMFYGSKALTTALALEALKKYLYRTESVS